MEKCTRTTWETGITEGMKRGEICLFGSDKIEFLIEIEEEDSEQHPSYTDTLIDTVEKK
jgi:hypothetical protein